MKCCGRVARTITCVDVFLVASTNIIVNAQARIFSNVGISRAELKTGLIGPQLCQNIYYNVAGVVQVMSRSDPEVKRRSKTGPGVKTANQNCFRCEFMKV